MLHVEVKTLPKAPQKTFIQDTKGVSLSDQETIVGQGWGADVCESSA